MGVEVKKGTAYDYLSNPGDDIFLLQETAMQIREYKL